MKVKLILVAIVLLAISAATIYLRFGGVTNERIADKLDSRSEQIINRIDDRYSALDKKLDRIESKLDRLLEIANRPLPDGLRENP